jgi:hypothetical protein
MPTGTDSRGVSLWRAAAGSRAGIRQVERAKPHAKKNRVCIFLGFSFNWLGDDNGSGMTRKKVRTAQTANGLHIDYDSHN